ncbi:hypothetical protein ACXC9Q_29580 [Kribbella sp. CWNU-51]
MAYKKYLPAAKTLADTIGRNSGLGSDEVVRRMAVVTADQKFRAAAEMIYDGSDLPGLMPSEQRAEAVRRIQAAIGPEFAKVENITATDSAERRRESSLVGAHTAKAAYGVVRDLRNEWSMPAPDQQVQTQRSQQAPGQAAVARAGLTGSKPLSSTTRLSADQHGSRRAPTTSGQERQSPTLDR